MIIFDESNLYTGDYLIIGFEEINELLSYFPKISKIHFTQRQYLPKLISEIFIKTEESKNLDCFGKIN